MNQNCDTADDDVYFVQMQQNKNCKFCKCSKLYLNVLNGVL